MAIYAKAGGDFTPAPEGTWQGVCIDVVDKGIVKYQEYGKSRHMVQIRWVLEAEPPLPSGKPHMAVRSFGLTLGEKSALRPFLEAWRGRRFSEEELSGFDVETLIGANGLVQILHNRVNGTTYANVHVVTPLPKVMNKMVTPSDYIRECNRPNYRPPASGLEIQTDDDPPTEGDWTPF